MTAVGSVVRARRDLHTNALAWIFALSIAGYPLAGMLAAATGLPSAFNTIPFRLLVALIGSFILLQATIARTSLHTSVALLGFLLLYALRLTWDLLFAGVPGAGEALLFLVATVVIPVVAMQIGIRGWDERKSSTILFLLGSTGCMIGVAMQVLGYGAAQSLTELTGRLSFESVNPITFGHVGASTLIAALAAWPLVRNPASKAVLLAGSVAAVTCMVLAASRGPILALVAALAVFSVVRGKWVHLAICVAAAAFYLPDLLASDGLELAVRFSTIEQDESSLERLIIQSNAIQQFLDSPLLGSAYVELLSNEYPHNIILESFMAMGIFGGLYFLIIAARAGMLALTRVAKRETLIPLIFFQYFVGAQLSGSIWGAAGFWIAVAALFASRHADRQQARISGVVLAATSAPQTKA